MDMSLNKLRGWWWTGRPGVLQSMGSRRVGHDWAAELNYPLTWREGYHTALHSIIFTLSLCHQEVHHVQKCNKSFFDWWDGLWTLQSVFSEYNSQKQLWKYLKVLSSFFLTSWLILNKFFLFFLIDKGEGEQGKSYKCVSLYVNMVSSVTCAFHFNF